MGHEWDDVLRQVRELVEDKTKRLTATLWYRGQSDFRWPLLSRMHRHVDELVTAIGMTVGDREAMFPDTLKSTYREFSNEAFPLLDPAERNPWGIRAFCCRNQSLRAS